MDALLPGLFGHCSHPPTWTSCHVAIGDDHSELNGVCVRVELGHLLNRFFNGTVGEGSHAFVFNPIKIPDKFLLVCELAEHILRLGEVQASYGPGDVDLVFVVLISQPFGKGLGEILHIFQQDARWGLL